MRADVVNLYPSIWHSKRSQPSKPEQRGRKFDRLFAELIASGHNMKSAKKIARKLAMKG